MKTQDLIFVEALEGVRFTRPTQDGDPWHYYQARHSEEDWGVPCQIEAGNVIVNFWGTVVTRDPIDFENYGAGYEVYPLSQAEQDAILEARECGL